MFSSKKLTLVVAGLAAFLVSCGGGHEEKAAHAGDAPALAVRVVEVAKTEVPESFEATGTVRARTAASISAKVMAYVESVKVDTGDRVAEGQTLVTLDARDLDVHVRQAQAALNEAQTAMAEVKQGIAAAQANLKLTQTTHKRIQDLFEKKSVTNQEFDESTARLKVAEANYAMAQSKQQQLDAKIAQAQEGLAAARVMRSYAEIKAPFAGVVTQKNVEPGVMTAPGMPLLTIERGGAYRLEVPIEESRLGSVRSGQTARVALESLGKSTVARVSEVVPSIDPGSRSFVVKLDLPANPLLRSGMFGRAVFESGSRRAVTVPNDAIRQQGQVQSVFQVAGGRAQARLVKTGRGFDDTTEILAGLDGGEKIVSSPPTTLRDGARVEVRP